MSKNNSPEIMRFSNPDMYKVSPDENVKRFIQKVNKIYTIYNYENNTFNETKLKTAADGFNSIKTQYGVTDHEIKAYISKHPPTNIYVQIYNKIFPDPPVKIETSEEKTPGGKRTRTNRKPKRRISKKRSSIKRRKQRK